MDEVIDEAACKLMIDDVKPKQREAIISYVSGNDTFVVLPTRYGKSLIYALLPLIYILLYNSIDPRHRY